MGSRDAEKRERREKDLIYHDIIDNIDNITILSIISRYFDENSLDKH